MYAFLDPAFFFPRFLELPERALQGVAKHLQVGDVCRLELASKAVIRRLAQVYAFTFCCPSYALPDRPSDLSTEELRLAWNAQCKDKALRSGGIRKKRYPLAYPYMYPRNVHHVTYCLQQ
jgi:hypothetical protein